MKTIILNIEDSIFDEIINSLFAEGFY